MSPTSPRQPSAGGPRQQASTSPLKVHRDSHLIHKASSSSPPSSSSTNSSVSSSSGATNIGAAHRPAPRHKGQQQPVIIYTHSPKVIRTNPRDFMSIVQKLTGLEGTGAANNAVSVVSAQDESSSSSESCAHAQSSAPPTYMDPQLMPPPSLDAHFMPEIPLFAPGASELLCAPRGLYRQFPPVDAVALGPVMSTNINNAGAGSGGDGVVFSPSMVEAMKMFPDY